MAQSNLPTQADIDDIDQQLRNLAEEASFLKGRRRQMMLAAWGVEVGSIVRYTGDRWNGLLGQVTEVREPYRLERDRPWVMVKRQKRDGTFGGNPVHFFGDWEKADALAQHERSQTEG